MYQECISVKIIFCSKCICTDFLHNYHCRIFILKFPLLLVNISSSHGYIMLIMQSFYSTVLIYHLACPFFHRYIFCKFPTVTKYMSVFVFLSIGILFFKNYFLGLNH